MKHKYRNRALMLAVMLIFLLCGCSPEFLKKVVPGLDPDSHPKSELKL